MFLALPLLAGCAQMGERPEPPAPASLRFAQTLDQADEAVDEAIGRMDGFERMAQREDNAIAFAIGGRQVAAGRFTAPPAGVSEAAGRVLTLAFTALGDYAQVLAAAAGGQRVRDAAAGNGQVLAQAAAKGLDAVQAASGTPVLAPVRTAGVAGIAALADLPAVLAQRREAPSLAALVQEGQPHVAAVIAMLHAVIGPEPGLGTRGAIRARREGLDAQQARFLAALRTDGRIGAGERYSIFRSLAEGRDNDPAQGNLEAINELLTAIEQAHAALAADRADAEAKVAALELAVARLSALTEGAQRG
jgi:hypothetical protein